MRIVRRGMGMVPVLSATLVVVIVMVVFVHVFPLASKQLPQVGASTLKIDMLRLECAIDFSPGMGKHTTPADAARNSLFTP